MNEHLPECRTSMIPDFHNERWICICAPLRACERRIREDDKNTFLRAAYDTGRRDALDAARKAVETMRDALYTHYRIGCEPPGKVDWSQHRKCDPVDDILAAIDALQEEK